MHGGKVAIGNTTIYATRTTAYHYQFILAEIMKDIMKKETSISFIEESAMTKGIAAMKKIPLLSAFRNLAYGYVMGKYSKPGSGFQVPLLAPEQMKQIYNKYIHNSLTFESELTSGNPNVGTPANKKKKADGSLDYFNPIRPMVTKGFK